MSIQNIIYIYIRICRTVLFLFNTHHRLEAMAHGFIQKLILKVTRYQQCMPNGMANPLQAIAFRKC